MCIDCKKDDPIERCDGFDYCYMCGCDDKQGSVPGVEVSTLEGCYYSLCMDCYQKIFNEVRKDFVQKITNYMILVARSKSEHKHINLSDNQYFEVIEILKELSK